MIVLDGPVVLYVVFLNIVTYMVCCYDTWYCNALSGDIFFRNFLFCITCMCTHTRIYVCMYMVTYIYIYIFSRVFPLPPPPPPRPSRPPPPAPIVPTPMVPHPCPVRKAAICAVVSCIRHELNNDGRWGGGARRTENRDHIYTHDRPRSNP